MSGDRMNYWRWIKEGVGRNYSIFPLELENYSMKASLLRKYNLKFNELNSVSSDAIFSLNVYEKNLSIILDPKIFAKYWPKENLAGLLVKGRTEGVILSRIKNKLGFPYRKIADIKYLRRLLSFTYYCLKNRYFLQLPLLIMSYALYQCSFFIGWKSSNSHVQSHKF
jgi:hypothetical protein